MTRQKEGRRQFLRGVAFGSAGLVLAACGAHPVFLPARRSGAERRLVGARVERGHLPLPHRPAQREGVNQQHRRPLLGVEGAGRLRLAVYQIRKLAYAAARQQGILVQLENYYRQEIPRASCALRTSVSSTPSRHAPW